MTIPLPIHLFIHLILSLLAGFLVWRFWGYRWASLISAIVTGVGIDVDHFFDYYFAFGSRWNFKYFINGYQFLKSDKMYVLFHGWEYVIILAVAAIFVKSRLGKSIFLALALGLFLHLCADVAIDQVPAINYSVIYRTANGFSDEKLDPKDIQRNMEERQKLNWN